MHSENQNSIRLKINALFDSLKGDFAVAFKTIEGDSKSFFINEHLIFHAASTMKTFLMIEIFKQASQKKIYLCDMIMIKNRFKSIVDDSEFALDITQDNCEELYNFIGKNKSIRELVNKMITVSSNLATNILIEIAGAKNVTETMKTIGANDTKVLRGVEDAKAFQLGLNNVVTAFDLLQVFENLLRNNFVDSYWTDEMIEILSQQKDRTIIPAKLPPKVKVANKTGRISGVVHDSGIVFLPDGRKYILILLSKNVNDENAVSNAQAEASRLIYEYLNHDN